MGKNKSAHKLSFGKAFFSYALLWNIQGLKTKPYSQFLIIDFGKDFFIYALLWNIQGSKTKPYPHFLHVLIA